MSPYTEIPTDSEQVLRDQIRRTDLGEIRRTGLGQIRRTDLGHNFELVGPRNSWAREV